MYWFCLSPCRGSQVSVGMRVMSGVPSTFELFAWIAEVIVSPMNVVPAGIKPV